MSPQIWSSKEVTSFQNSAEFNLYLRENEISCVFAVDAMLTNQLLRGIISESGVV